MYLLSCFADHLYLTYFLKGYEEVGTFLHTETRRKGGLLVAVLRVIKLLGDGEMAQEVRALVPKPDDPPPIPDSHARLPLLPT